MRRVLVSAALLLLVSLHAAGASAARDQVRSSGPDVEERFAETQKAQGFGSVLGGLAKKVTNSLIGSTPQVAPLSPNDQLCVICQFLVQRVHAEVEMSGLKGGLPFTDGPGSEKQDEKAAFVGVPQQTANPADLFFTPPPTGGMNDEQAEATTSFVEIESKKEEFITPGTIGQAHGVATVALANEGKAAGTPDIFKDRRTRQIEMYNFRPTQIRFSNLYDGAMRSQRRAEERYENNMYNTVAYQALEEMCAKHMPRPWFNYCQGILQSYVRIAEGLRWGDRPDAICMQLDFCNKDSYVQQGPHATFKDT